MPVPYPMELRIRIMTDIENGETEQDTADKFSVSRQTVQAYKRQLKATGSFIPIDPKGRAGRKRKLEPYHEHIRNILKETPDATLKEIAEKLPVKVHHSVVDNELKRIGITRKKKIFAAEQDREDVVERRKKWAEFIKRLNPYHLVFIDESGFRTNMTRRYGRCEKGKRLVDKIPLGHWLNITGIYGISRRGIIVPRAFTERNTNARFLQYVKEDLCPKLRKGDVVIMDNLSQHKQAAVEKLIEPKGCELHFLPPYSPDDHPIEKSFSQVKSFVRKQKIRNVEELIQFWQTMPERIRRACCKNYFK
ncbi:MAG: IS630 family transposase, partial [Planctomycetaceae bacterium]|nr:IS630 family transposase [Planctomycetaceae bacterium]